MRRIWIAIIVVGFLLCGRAHINHCYEMDSDPTSLSCINSSLATVLFYDLSFETLSIPEVSRDGTPVKDETTGQQKDKFIAIPLIVGILAFGAFFFTFFLAGSTSEVSGMRYESYQESMTKMILMVK